MGEDKANTMSEKQEFTPAMVAEMFTGVDKRLDKLAEIVGATVSQGAKLQEANESNRNQLTDLYKKREQDIRDNKVKLPAILSAMVAVAVLSGGIMTSVLRPIVSAVDDNKIEFRNNHIETRSMVKDLEAQVAEMDKNTAVYVAVLQERDNQISERIDNLRQKDGQWVGADGRTATPAPHYQPFQRIE